MVAPEREMGSMYFVEALCFSEFALGLAGLPALSSGLLGAVFRRVPLGRKEISIF